MLEMMVGILDGELWGGVGTVHSTVFGCLEGTRFSFLPPSPPPPPGYNLFWGAVTCEKKTKPGSSLAFLACAFLPLRESRTTREQLGGSNGKEHRHSAKTRW